MNFRIADTFTASLARLTNDEQKAVKTTAFDLQLDRSNPGMRFHKLDPARDRNFWSVRVSRDLRLMVHRTRSSLLLCYVGHQDHAYAWAERRKLETHPTTGAAQLVEIRERVREIEIPKYVAAHEDATLQPDAVDPADTPSHSSAAPQVDAVAPSPSGPPLFAGTRDDDLLAYGVPPEWLSKVRADRLLPRTIADVDGIVEDRGGTVSVVNGPEPVVELFDDEAAEIEAAAAWLAERPAEGVPPHEIGVFVRSEDRLDRATAAIEGRAALRRPRRAPRDDERHLLYVACTRARDHLRVSGVRPGSEFLDDMRG